MVIYRLQGKEFKECIMSNKNNLKTNDNYMFGDVFLGFRYFSPIDLDDLDSMFFVAVHNGCVLGVLKVKRYANYNHRFVKENETIKNYVAIRFIDVHKDYRNKGISKELIRMFSDYQIKLGATKDIRLSPLSDEGKSFKVKETFERFLIPYNFKVKIVRR